MSVPRLYCPDCGVGTPNPDDIAALYCPRCHWWTSDPDLGPARREQMPEKIEAQATVGQDASS